MRDLPSGQAVLRLWFAFAILCIANLAAFSMTASQALLPIIMALDGIPETTTGAALSAAVVPVVLVGLLCGRIIARVGAALVLSSAYALALALTVGDITKAHLAFTLVVGDLGVALTAARR